jgi:hypothetical protein
MGETMTVVEAAKAMGINPQFLRAALMQGKFPFGVGVKMEHNEFYISKIRFEKYIEGVDLGRRCAIEQ